MQECGWVEGRMLALMVVGEEGLKGMCVVDFGGTAGLITDYRGYFETRVGRLGGDNGRLGAMGGHLFPSYSTQIQC